MLQSLVLIIFAQRSLQFKKKGEDIYIRNLLTSFSSFIKRKILQHEFIRISISISVECIGRLKENRFQQL
jgi:hypothetical protein